MVLYTCNQAKLLGRMGHPCGAAALALEDAGYEYELKKVAGYRALPWDWPKRNRDRAEVRELSGTNEVPILVLDDGEVISGSGAIKRWAKQNPAPRAAGGAQASE